MHHQSLFATYAIEYQIIPLTPININYWLGSILRNNLLYAASNIKVNNNQSLYDILANKDIENDIADIPKGYAIQCTPILEMGKINTSLYFRILLFGNTIAYSTYLNQAVLFMCSRGIGHPQTPMQIIDHNEGFIDLPTIDKTPDILRIEFTTPVSLYNNRAKSASKRGILDKQNGAPNLYYLIYSLTKRINRLQYLYQNETIWTEDEMEEWCKEARDAQIEECSFKRIILKGTPRKDHSKPIFYSGYIGHMVLSGINKKYMSLLLLGTYLNAGNNTVYGLGQYEILTR